METNIVKNHRTILFIDARDKSERFSERVNRLVESLNGNQIKVDVHEVTVQSGGVAVNPIGYTSYVASDTGFDVDALRATASEYGYDQVLFSVPA